MAHSIHTILVVAFALTGLGIAQDADVSARERAVLEILLEKGVITQAEFDARLGKLGEEVPVAEVPQTVKKPAPEPRVPEEPAVVAPPPPPEPLRGAAEQDPELSPLMSRNVLRAGWGIMDQEWTPSAPQWGGSGHAIFAEGLISLSDSYYGFAELEEFSSGDTFIQTAMIAGAGWDTHFNDRLAAYIKGGFSHFSSETSYDGEADEDTLFVGGGVRYLLSEELLGELEFWQGREEQGGSSVRISYLTSSQYGVFVESLSRNDYSGLRFGVSLFL